MKSQRGFALTGYLALAGAVVFLLMFAAIKVQSSRLAVCKADHKTFVAQTKAAGDAQEARTKAEIGRQASLLKQSEVQNAKLSAGLATANQRLRDERASRRLVPAAPEGSKRPDLACFDRAELDATLRRFAESVAGLTEQGDQNTLRLKLSRDWAADALK